jgi:hypothetical protein
MTIPKVQFNIAKEIASKIKEEDLNKMLVESLDEKTYEYDELVKQLEKK